MLDGGTDVIGYHNVPTDCLNKTPCAWVAYKTLVLAIIVEVIISA